MPDTEKETYRCPRCGYFDHSVEVAGEDTPAEEVQADAAPETAPELPKEPVSENQAAPVAANAVEGAPEQHS